MLKSMGLQRVGHDVVPEKQKRVENMKGGFLEPHSV